MLGIVSDKEFEKELIKSNKASRVNSIHVEQNESIRVSSDENSPLNETQREALDGNIHSIETNQADELKDDESLCGKIVEINKPGRRLGDNNVPDSLRKIIGAESIESGRKAGLNLASHFGISPSSVSAYSHGSTGTTSYDKPNEGLLNHMNNARERIIKRARGKLLLSLNSLNQEKIESSKARDIASIAKDMSAVIKNMEDRTIQSVHEGPKFIFYSPTIRDEKNFDIINVKE